MNASRDIWRSPLASLTAVMVAGAPASAQQQKPNILVIMGDDIGYWNISASSEQSQLHNNRRSTS